MDATETEHWIFGYGSLIWRPDFEFLEQRIARLPGFVRRFWQASHDHRGTPDAPGRVVTLVEQARAHCDGMVFRVAAPVMADLLPQLDHREKNGYERQYLPVACRDGGSVTALVYVATPDNEAYAGPMPTKELAHHIARSHGPSGSNADYLFELARALEQLKIDDDHVATLAAAVQEIVSAK